jgi:hypothetical protein
MATSNLSLAVSGGQNHVRNHFQGSYATLIRVRQRADLVVGSLGSFTVLSGRPTGQASTWPLREPAAASWLRAHGEPYFLHTCCCSMPSWTRSLFLRCYFTQPPLLWNCVGICFSLVPVGMQNITLSSVDAEQCVW